MENTYLTRLNSINEEYDAFFAQSKPSKGTTESETYRDSSKRVILGTLQDVCTVLRDLESSVKHSNMPDDLAVLSLVQKRLDMYISWAYNDEMFDFLPSFAHDLDSKPILDPSTGMHS